MKSVDKVSGLVFEEDVNENVDVYAIAGSTINIVRTNDTACIEETMLSEKVRDCVLYDYGQR